MNLKSENTHRIEIVIVGLFPMQEEKQMELKVSGDGSLEYFVETMKAALIAFGFVPDTVSKIKIVDEVDEE